MISREKIFFSQCGQDKFLYEHFFKSYNNPGVFIELGALDGILISNSLFYEKTLGWNGICIEPTEHYYKQLIKSRKCYTFNDVIYDEDKEIIFYSAPPCCDSLNGIKEKYDNRHLARIDRETKQYKYKKEDIKEIIKKPRTMDSVLKEVGIKIIDFLSLDVEGSELNVLKSINWNDTKIKVICVEDNYGDKRLHEFLKELNYIFFKKLEGDFIYYRKDLIQPI